MRVLYGITKSNFGGAQRYVFDLAVASKNKGHNTAVLCGLPGQGGEGLLVDKLRAHDIQIIPIESLGRDVSPLEDLRAFFVLMNTLHEFKPDVFHINSSKMGGMGGLAARVMRVKKIIFTSHGWAFNEPRPFWQKWLIKFLHWFTILLSHTTICVSEKTKRDMSGMPFIQSKMKVIYNGIKPFDIVHRNEARQKLSLGIPESTLIVGAMGELHKIKGYDTLLHAWQKFEKKNNKSRLIICGDGEEKENLETLTKQLNISDSVIFKGYVDNSRTLLHGMDIFVMPSRSENLPYSLLEAGLAGLPVIAAEVGGIPEIIESGANGILVPKEDDEALFSSLVLLAEAPDIRKRIGKELKLTVGKKFSPSLMTQETFKAYL